VSTLTQQEEHAKPISYAQPAGQCHFWLRRLHSLAGIMFGGYIVVHLVVNATGLWPRVYQQNVDKIHQMEPMLPVIEILAIFGPLLLHLLYGLYVASVGVSYPTTTRYSYGGNLRYLLQRITSFILIVFVVYHIGMLHKWGFALVGLKKAPDFNAVNLAYQTTVGSIKAPFEGMPVANAAVITLYLLGIWSAAFHFANGLWTAAITWGLTVTRTAQQRWGKVCCGLGIFLMLVGTVAWYAFAIAGNPQLDESKTETQVMMSVDGKDYMVPVQAPEKGMADPAPAATPAK
jgi:succinate dehydrogenase / fumarate reductase cytochrome b subunit